MAKKINTDDISYYKSEGALIRDDGVIVKLIHDISQDVWVSDEGWRYVKNTSRLEMIYWIRIDVDIIRTRYLGKLITLKWLDMDLPDAALGQIKEGIFHALRHQSPLTLQTYRLAIRQFSQVSADLGVDLSKGLEWVNLADFIEVFTRMTHTNAARFRALHGLMVDLELKGADSSRHDALMEFRLLKKEQMLGVLTWNPATGALTTAELEVLRHHLMPTDAPESSNDHYCRLALRLLVTFGRRPVQISCVKDNGILATQDERIPRRIEFPGAKYQRNSPSRFYDIPDDILLDIESFSNRDDIKSAQQDSGFLLMRPSVAVGVRRQPISTERFNSHLHGWVKKQGIISPRTNKPMNITANRIRHTVATQLIMKGWSSEDVTEFLEHISEQSVVHYIDAVGSELSPEFASSTGHLAAIFESVSGNFKGKLVSRPSGKIQKPIVVPDHRNMSIVGQCGMSGSCPNSPFSACINGCPHFLFFKDADVTSIRGWINSETKRWADSEDVGKRSRTKIEFARIDLALKGAESQR